MTGGPERRDESVNFSLKELMKLEEERITQEREAREAREAVEAAAREEAGRRERAELATKERADADERERARRLQYEEESRREAMQRAAVEQARITVEARTRAEESERERRHEIELQRMRAETVKQAGPGGFIASGLAGAAVCLAACLVTYFAVAKPASEARVAELDRAVASANGHADELGRRVEEQSARVAQLEQALAASQEELSTARAASTAGAAAAPHVPTRRTAPTGPSRAKGSNDGRNPDGPPCIKGDPLCFHIDTH